jgi:hypothetical protein
VTRRKSSPRTRWTECRLKSGPTQLTPASFNRGTMCLRRLNRRFSLLPVSWAKNAVKVPDRLVRFSEQFFNRISWLLPEDRGLDGTPSITDFLLLDLPRVRDRLAADYLANTFATDEGDVRVCMSAGVLTACFALYCALEGETVEVFWLTIDEGNDDDQPDYLD